MSQTRELEKIGLKFSILQPVRWNADVFAGICIANGCDFATARRIAEDLQRVGYRFTTVRPLKDWETFKAACRMVGIVVVEVEPQ